MKLLTALFLIILLQTSNFSQVENVPADNYVYDFLKVLSVKGIITGYDDMVLPLSKRTITNYLAEAERNKVLLSENEKNLLERLKIKLDIKENNTKVNFTDVFPSGLNLFFSNDKAKYFYSYQDTSFNVYLNPILEDKFIYSSDKNSTANLFNFGGKLYGSYSDWFGFYVSVSNGIQTGDRSVAELDQAVNQSFTFKNTRTNYFDNTEGYARIEKGKIGLEIGRERILWGRGINKLLISNNAPVFDFLKFNASLGIFSFDFLHGWLVQPVTYTWDTILNSYVKNKSPKYIAISRFGVSPSNNFSFGVSQIIIYANRPVELAYMNPFLFFESAQRSLNDLDNSFLAFDAKFKVINGLEISSIINFDDVDFKTITTEGFGSIQTRYAWQTNIIISNPILPENISIDIDYLIIRPYMFTHLGTGESLTYTNNGYMLGPDLQPNSIEISLRLNYIFSQDLIISAGYDNIRHGSNIYDSNGNLVRNVGGDIIQYYKLGDSRRTYILDGIADVTNKISFNLEYEFTLGFYLGFQYDYISFQKSGLDNKKENNFWGVFRYNIL
jgi:Capsule assembly protein Wzi